MNFLGKLFGKKTREKARGKVPAVALACDTFLMFDGDDALYDFATNILQTKWPDIKLHKKAQVEVAMNYKGDEDKVEGVLRDSLQQSIDNIILRRDQYDIEFFWVHSQTMPMKVWCMAAVKR